MDIALLRKQPPPSSSVSSGTVQAEAHYEFHGGTALERPLEGLAHGRLTARIARLVGNYVEAWRLGETTGADTGYLLSQGATGPQIVCAPDVAFVSAARLAEGADGPYVTCAPDLAVEVISSADRALDLELRVLHYLRAGTTQVWVVYPATKTVVVHERGHVTRLTATTVLTGSDILPGFSLPLASLFDAG